MLKNSNKLPSYSPYCLQKLTKN